MIKYDKLMKKLSKFDELPNKKKDKLLETIICSKEVQGWVYSVGEGEQPITRPMVDEIFDKLAIPSRMKRLTKFISKKNPEDFDKTSRTVAFMVGLRAVDITNTAGQEMTDGYKEGLVKSNKMKDFNEKAVAYKEYIDDLFAIVKEKSKGDIKHICKKANVPKGLVYATYFFIPSNDFIPKFKINSYMNLCLKEIYKWVGNHGIQNIKDINWHHYFVGVLNSDIVTSGAISVLLEGVRRIDDYRKCKYFDDVAKIWDSLSYYSLSELDRAPENVRRQMMDLYVKRLDRIYSNGRGPRLRVNLLDTPSEFVNLRKTVNEYSDRLAKIMGIKNRQEPSYEKENKEVIKDAVEKVKTEDIEPLPTYSFDSEHVDDDDEDADE